MRYKTKKQLLPILIDWIKKGCPQNTGIRIFTPNGIFENPKQFKYKVYFVIGDDFRKRDHGVIMLDSSHSNLDYNTKNFLVKINEDEKKWPRFNLGDGSGWPIEITAEYLFENWKEQAHVDTEIKAELLKLYTDREEKLKRNHIDILNSKNEIIGYAILDEENQKIIDIVWEN